jgi:hypothetical protein
VRHLIVDQADDGSSPFSSAKTVSEARPVREGRLAKRALAYARASHTLGVSSQIGSRHLPLKQGSVSSSLTWRTNLECGGIDAALDSVLRNKSL